MIFINIGFNKGYNFARWAKTWLPDLGIDTTIWHRSLLQAGLLPKFACGMCQECKTEINSNKNILTVIKQVRNTSVEIFRNHLMIGVDINIENHKLIKNITEQLNKRESITLNKLNIDLFHVAISNVSNNSLYMYPCKQHGDEYCSIVPSKKLHGRNEINLLKHYKKINTMNLDDIINRSIFHNSIYNQPQPPYDSDVNGQSPLQGGRRLPSVDILHIDTEGYDAQAILGARSVLKKRMIRMIMFEYHHRCPWPFTRLSTILHMVQGYGYECYFNGNNRLWPLTHGCWDDRYEHHRWSNVLCVEENDPWVAVVRGVAVKATVAAAAVNEMPAEEQQAKEKLFSDKLQRIKKYLYC